MGGGGGGGLGGGRWEELRLPDFGYLTVRSADANPSASRAVELGPSSEAACGSSAVQWQQCLWFVWRG